MFKRNFVVAFSLLFVIFSCDLSQGSSGNNKPSVTNPQVENEEAISNATVYLAGQRSADKHGREFVSYFIDDVKHPLQYKETGAYILDSKVDHDTGDIYNLIQPYTNEDLDIGSVLYKNDKVVENWPFSHGYRADKIYIENSKVYTIGQVYDDSIKRWVYCYEVDGIFTNLDLSYFGGYDHGNTGAMTVNNGDVYVAGYVFDGKGYHGVIWKNGKVLYDIPNSSYINLKDVVYANGDIYSIGDVYGESYSTIPRFYKNNKVLYTGDKYTEFNTIYTTNGTNFFVGGSLNNKPVVFPYYGNDSIEDTIQVGNDNGSVLSITADINNDELILSGTTNERGVYWKLSGVNFSSVSKYLSDETITKLPNIDFYNGKLYFTAVETEENNNSYAVYWKNGEEVILSNGSRNSKAESIYVENNNVYVAVSEREGYYYKNFCYYYVNNERYELKSNYSHVDIIKIFVINGDVYVIGNTSDDGVVVWKNGVITGDLSSEFSNPYLEVIDAKLVGDDIYTYIKLEDDNCYYVLKNFTNPVKCLDEISNNGVVFNTYNDMTSYAYLENPTYKEQIPYIKYNFNGTEGSVNSNYHLRPNDIYTNGTDNYICGSAWGSNSELAFVIDNGTVKFLSDNDIYSVAKQISEINNSIFISGVVYNISTGYLSPAYWVNEKLNMVQTGAYESEVNDMFVVE